MLNNVVRKHDKTTKAGATHGRRAVRIKVGKLYAEQNRYYKAKVRKAKKKTKQYHTSKF